MSNRSKLSPAVWIGLALALITLALYWPVGNHAFIKFDDPDYVTSNVQIKKGVTGAGVVWAFTHAHSSNWHPLTWVSHMADWQMFGDKAGGHHLVNLLFHVLNTVLVFLVLRKLTGSMWRSAFVAALFAWHPLHVESVAWVSERKDVLSGFFWLLTMGAYGFYVEKRSWRRYALTLLFFALGLMSKPMVVTLPCVLLLLDWWPLRRWDWPGKTSEAAAPQKVEPLRFLLLEKIPFVALTIGSAIATFWAQKAGGSVAGTAENPIAGRVMNALISYAEYLRKMVWPSDLAVFYPMPEKILWSEVAAAGMVLLAFSFLAFRWVRRWPFLTVGWLWYLGTLVPVIGLVQVGDQAMADRYTYLPFIGIFIMLIWGAGEIARHRPQQKKLLTALGVAGLAVCLALTSIQVRLWKDTGTLFKHTVDVTRNNWVALNFVAMTLFDAGKTEEAIPYYREALRIEPNDFPSLNNLGNALARLGKLDEALKRFELAARIKPDEVRVQNWLGVIYAEKGRFNEAAQHFAQAARLAPDDIDVVQNLGVALYRQGKFNEAVAQFNRTLSLNTNHVEAHLHLAISLTKIGKADEGLAHFQTVLRLQPDHPGALTELGLAAGAREDFTAAAGFFSALIKARPEDAHAHYQLGVARLGQRQAEEAISQFREAMRLRPGWPPPITVLAWILATHEDAKFRDGREALALALQALRVTNPSQMSLRLFNTVAAAQAEAGKFDDAVATMQVALNFVKKNGPASQIPELEQRLGLYKAGKPFRDPGLSPTK